MDLLLNNWILYAEILVGLLIIVAVLLFANHHGKFGKAEDHVHKWQHMATEWVAGKEVHVMVCWQHEQPATERRMAEPDAT